MRATALFGLVVALLVGAVGCAREPSTRASPADVRAVVDRIVRSAHRLDLDGRTMPDLTSEVNALLAMDANDVLNALAEGLAAFRYQGMHRDDYRVTLETLAALLVGLEFEPDGTWQDGATLHVHDGFVLVSFLNDGTFSTGPDPWTSPSPLDLYTKGSTALRAPLVPDGAALLRRICGPAEMPAPFRDDPSLRVSAGLALGFAARSDPDLAKRIFHEANRVGNRTDRLAVLAFALGRLATDEAAAAMEARFLAAAPRRDDAPFALLVEASRAGLPEEFLGRIWLRIPAVVPEAVEHFEWAAAGEVVARAKLTAAVADRTEASLTQLGNAALGQAVSSLSVETFRAILDMGLEAESPDVLTRLLWPLDRGESQAPGYPDPVEQARRFRKDLGAGITLRPGELDAPGIYAEFVSAGPPDEHSVGEPPDSGIRLEASIEGEEIRIEVENGGKDLCCLNPKAFEFGSLVSRSTAWKDGDPWDPDEQVPHLRLGRVATGMVPTVRASDLILLAPGESRRFTWPLGKGIPADKRVYVLLQDEISVEGDLPAPLLRHAAPVRAR